MGMACLKLGAVLLLAGSAPAVAGNLIKNGSFEKPAVPDGGYTRFSVGQKIGPWTVTGVGNVDVMSTHFVYVGYKFPAKKGVQWLDLTGCCGGNRTGVKQTIDTVSGATYDISLYVGSQYTPTGNLGIDSTVDVYVNGVQIATFVAKGKEGSDTQVWRKFSTQFVTQSAQSTIEFMNGDPSNDTDNGIDAVSVTLVAVP
jgi:hypothetical protein